MNIGRLRELMRCDAVKDFYLVPGVSNKQLQDIIEKSVARGIEKTTISSQKSTEFMADKFMQIVESGISTGVKDVYLYYLKLINASRGLLMMGSGVAAGSLSIQVAKLEKQISECGNEQLRIQNLVDFENAYIQQLMKSVRNIYDSMSRALAASVSQIKEMNQTISVINRAAGKTV